MKQCKSDQENPADAIKREQEMQDLKDKAAVAKFVEHRAMTIAEKCFLKNRKIEYLLGPVVDSVSKEQ